MTENHNFVPEELGVPYGTQYPDSYRQILVENGILNPDYTPNEATAAALGWQLTAPEATSPAEQSPPRPERPQRRVLTPSTSMPVDEE